MQEDHLPLFLILWQLYLIHHLLYDSQAPLPIGQKERRQGYDISQREHCKAKMFTMQFFQVMRRPTSIGQNIHHTNG